MKTREFGRAGSAESTGAIFVFCIGVGIAWVAMAQFIDADAAHRLGLKQPGPGTCIPLVLLTYSFVHAKDAGLFINLAALVFVCGLVNRCVSAASFVRLYSLGTLLGGAVYLLILQFAAKADVMTGPYAGLVALCCAMFIIEPELEGDRIILGVVVGVLTVSRPFTGSRTGGLLLSTVLPLVSGIVAGLLYAGIAKVWTSNVAATTKTQVLRADVSRGSVRRNP